MLKCHQAVKQLFWDITPRYRQVLLWSDCSVRALILSKRRNRLSDKLFETLLMLKTNKQFRWRWSGITYYLHLKSSCLSSSCMLFMWTITVNGQVFEVLNYHVQYLKVFKYSGHSICPNTVYYTIQPSAANEMWYSIANLWQMCSLTGEVIVICH